jgi:hypothetical protein
MPFTSFLDKQGGAFSKENATPQSQHETFTSWATSLGPKKCHSLLNKTGGNYPLIFQIIVCYEKCPIDINYKHDDVPVPFSKNVIFQFANRYTAASSDSNVSIFFLCSFICPWSTCIKVVTQIGSSDSWFCVLNIYNLSMYLVSINVHM